MNDLKVGIAGHGVVGKRRHQFVTSSPDATVVAVCDRAYAGKEGMREGIEYFTDYHDLLDLGLDLLFVCVPNYLAPEITAAGLDSGCHVFCEKPPGRSVTDLLGVIEAERRNPGRKLKYGFNHRYHGSVIDALEGVGSGTFGKLLSIDGVYGKSAIIVWPRPTDSTITWRGERSMAGGGILLDQGIHMVDLMHSFAGTLDVLYSRVSNARWGLDVEDEARAVMMSEGGACVGLLSTANLHEHTFNLRIVLEGGEYQLSGILSGTRSYGEEKLTVITPRPGGGGFPQKLTQSYPEDNSWSQEITEFIASVLHDRPVESGDSGEALRTMQTIERIYCSDPVWRSTYGLSEPLVPDDIADFLNHRSRAACDQ